LMLALIAIFAWRVPSADALCSRWSRPPYPPGTCSGRRSGRRGVQPHRTRSKFCGVRVWGPSTGAMLDPGVLPRPGWWRG
jgi:hypothetical protein